MKKTVCMVLIALLIAGTCLAESAPVEPESALALLDSPYFGYTDSYRMQTALTEFQTRHPDCDVEVIEFDGAYWKEQMLTYIMSGDNQVDIIPTYDDMYYSYLKHGLLDDLFEYDGFKEIVSGWRGMSRLFIKNDALYSVPISFICTDFNWNASLAERLGLEQPNPDRTWADFAALIDSFIERRAASGMNDVYLFAETNETLPLFIWYYTCAYQEQLINGTKRYDDKDFYDILTIWKQAIENNAFRMYSTITEVDFSKVLIQDSAWIAGSTDKPQIVFPKLGGVTAPVTVLGLGLYAKSEQKAKAAELLQIYSSYESDVPASAETGSRNYISVGFETMVYDIWAKYLAGNIADDAMVSLLDDAYQMSLNG